MVGADHLMRVLPNLVIIVNLPCMSGSVLSFLFGDDVVTLDIADKTNLISLTQRWDFVWTLARHIRLFGQEEMTVETQMEQDFLMGLSVELQSEQTYQWSRGWKKCIFWSRVKPAKTW